MMYQRNNHFVEVETKNNKHKRTRENDAGPRVRLASADTSTCLCRDYNMRTHLRGMKNP